MVKSQGVIKNEFSRRSLICVEISLCPSLAVSISLFLLLSPHPGLLLILII